MMMDDVYQLEDEDGSMADVEERLFEGDVGGLLRRLAVLLDINQYCLRIPFTVFDLHRALPTVHHQTSCMQTTRPNHKI